MKDFSFHELFKDFPEKRVKRGEFLLREGDAPSSAIYVVEGCLRSYVIDARGKEHIYQFAPEDWVISDEEALMENKPALLYIDAIEDSVIKFIPRPENKPNDVLNLADADDLIRKLERKTMAFRRRIIQLLSASAEERYLSFVDTYPNLVQRVPQKMIASYLGITPESLSRVRKDLAYKR